MNSLRFVLSLHLAAAAAPALAQNLEAEPENIAVSVEDANEEKAVAKKANAVTEPTSVRVGIRLTNFQKLVTIKDGKQLVRYQPLKELAHTLRARLGRKNHFFIDQYHIETKPMLWKKETMEYALRLYVYRRYGAFGQLEESIGHVDVKGVLGDRQGNVFVLYGGVKHRFRDKFGNPILDLVAGYKPAPKEPAAARTANKEEPKPQVRRAPRKAATANPQQHRKRF